MEKGDFSVYKPVFSVSSSVTSLMYMNIKFAQYFKITESVSSSLGCCRQLT